jgi:hypothetical protein
MANIREMLIGFGKSKQEDIETANVAAGIWRLGKLNTSFLGPQLNTENNAGELGNGHEFATQVYKTSWDVQGQIEKYLSAEFAAWVMSYGFGKSAKTGSGGNFVYTCTPLNPVSDGVELPYFTYVEQMRPGASAIIDRASIGCAVNGWTLQVSSGPGRANTKLIADIVGSGKFADPSTIALPSATAEKLIPSAGLACTINSVDYVTAKNIVSLEASWRNNLRLDAGFYPGSGYQTSGDASTGAIRGRMEIGDREATLQFIARFESGSTELDKVTAQTNGTAVITLTYDTNNSLQLTYHSVQFAVAELGEADGIVTVQVTCTPLYHSSNGLVTAVAKCNVDGICEAEPE